MTTTTTEIRSTARHADRSDGEPLRSRDLVPPGGTHRVRRQTEAGTAQPPHLPDHRSLPHERNTTTPGLQLAQARTSGGWTIVTVFGEVDQFTSGRLEDVLVSALDECPGVALDLSGVTFLDSTGLTALTVAHHQAHRRDGRFVLLGCPVSVERLLAITGLDRIIPIHHTRADLDGCEVCRSSTGGRPDDDAPLPPGE